MPVAAGDPSLHPPKGCAPTRTMGCFIGCLALIFPRVALVLVWLFGPSGYLSEPYPHVVWPILGFFFLPTTTLAFAYATHSLEPQGEVGTFGWLITIVAIFFDLGLHGGSGHAAARRRRGRDED